MVETPNAVVLTPSFAQGDTDDRPSPVPNSNKIRESAAAAAAPAKMAPHETALGDAPAAVGSRTMPA